MTRKTAVLVGNGKLESDLSTVVDNAQFMMRFNEPSLADDMRPAHGHAHAGRIEHGAASAFGQSGPSGECGAQVHKSDDARLSSRDHPQMSSLAQHPAALDGRGADWAMQTIKRTGITGKEIRITPRHSMLALPWSSGLPNPERARSFRAPASSASIMHSQTVSEWDAKLCGLSWEGGRWHEWQNERSWAENKIMTSRVSLIA